MDFYCERSQDLKRVHEPPDHSREDMVPVPSEAPTSLETVQCLGHNGYMQRTLGQSAR